MSKAAVTIVIVASVCGASLAAVPDPQLMTDHPVYRGELSASTLDLRIADAYRVFEERYGHVPATDTEKLVALWIWQCEHHMHSADPFVYAGPDHPDAREGGWIETRDHSLGQFSFGFSLCYTIHAQFSALVGHALGDMKRVRCPSVPGHTPFEAYVDGKWALADMTTGMMVFDDDGRPMSIAEIMAKIDVPVENGEPVAGYKDLPHGPYVRVDKATEDKWTADPRRGGFGQFRVTPFGDNWDVYRAIHDQKMLYGHDAMPVTYVLRAGESFTRRLDPGMEDGKTYVFWARDYYNIMGKPVHGPFRNVTFLDDPPVGSNRRGLGNARYGNGIFEYVPPLADGRYEQGLWPRAPKTKMKYTDGALKPAGRPGALIFQHVSPYVIAATSAKGGDREWKLRDEKCVNGAVVSGKVIGTVPVLISTDGKQWTTVGSATGEFALDFTDQVKGRLSYLIRLDVGTNAGLVDLKMRTVTQIARAVFPRLRSGTNTITYQANGVAPIHGGPVIQLAEQYRRKDLEEPGYRVYAIDAPGPIRHVAGAARCSGPDRGPWSVEFSIDGGKSWKVGMDDVTLTKSDSGWGGGRHACTWAQMNFPETDAKQALIRFGKGNVQSCEVYATYAQPVTSPLTVTYGWNQGNAAKTASHEIAAGAKTDTWTVKAGEGISAQWVRMEAK